MAITDANTNTNQTLPHLPSLRPSLATAQPQRTAEDMSKPEVQDPVLGSATPCKTGYFTGERVRRLIAERGGRWVRSFTKPGEVVSASEVERRLSNGIDSADDGECWVWMRVVSNYGYGEIRISGEQTMTHRLSYELAIGPIPAGLSILHSCDNRRCINPAHLRAGTQQDNIHDAVVRGRLKSPTCIGERNGQAVLTDDKVREILQLLRSGVSQQKVAKLVNSSQSAVSCVKLGKTWKHIDRKCYARS